MSDDAPPLRGAWADVPVTHRAPLASPQPPAGRAPRPKPAARKPHASLQTPSDAVSPARTPGVPAPLVSPPPKMSYAELAAKHRDPAKSESAPDTAAPAGRGALLAQKIEQGKKLSKNDFAQLGYSSREVETLRLHRSLKLRESERFQQMKQEALARQRAETLKSYERAAGAKPARAVLISDLLLSKAPALPPPESLPSVSGAKVAAKSSPAPKPKKKEKQPTAAGSAAPAQAPQHGAKGGNAWVVRASPAAAPSASPSLLAATDAPTLPVAESSPQTKPPAARAPKNAPLKASRGAKAAQPAAPSPNTKPPPAAVAAADAETEKPRVRVLAGGLTVRKNAKGVSSSLLAAVEAAAAAGDRSGAIPAYRKAKTVRASAVLTAAPTATSSTVAPPRSAAAVDGVLPKGFKVKQYRRIKKPTKVKYLVLQSRRRAFEEAVRKLASHDKTPGAAAAQPTKAARRASDCDATASAVAGPVADGDETAWVETDAEEEKSAGRIAPATSITAARRLARSRRDAVKALRDHARRVAQATEVHRLARKAFDDRDKDLLERRKREYAAAYGRVQRSHMHTVRRFFVEDAAPLPLFGNVAAPAAGDALKEKSRVPVPAAAPQSTTSAPVRDAAAKRDGNDENDADDDGPAGDAETEAIAKTMLGAMGGPKRVAVPELPAGGVVYPSMHLLTASGAHPAPWMIDRRFVPDPKFLAKGAPKGAPLPTIADLRRVVVWERRPWWWPPARVVRDYVTNVLTRELDKATEQLVSKLNGLQIKLKQNNPQKFKKQMRFVLGLREAQRGLNAKRVKLVIIAPDVEAADVLDAAVKKVIATCEANGVVYFFASSRANFGRAVGQFKNRVSLCAIYSAEGAFDELRHAVALAREAKAEWHAMNDARDGANGPGVVDTITPVGDQAALDAL